MKWHEFQRTAYNSGIPGNNQWEYSVYSTEKDTWLEVLIKEVEMVGIKQLRKRYRVRFLKWTVLSVILQR
jgi:hypothetical protein